MKMELLDEVQSSEFLETLWNRNIGELVVEAEDIYRKTAQNPSMEAEGVLVDKLKQGMDLLFATENDGIILTALLQMLGRIAARAQGKVLYGKQPRPLFGSLPSGRAAEILVEEGVLRTTG